MRRIHPYLLGSLGILGLASPAQGAAILMDFGSSPAYAGTDSPGHEDGLATGGVWNALASDQSTGFVDENGAAITGLTIDFGTGSVNSVDYATATRAASYTNGATYPLWDSALGDDHVVRDTGGFTGVGIAVSGLAPGEYDFYLTGFRGDNSINAARDYRVAWDLGTTAITDFTNATQETLTNDSPTTVNDWIAGDNYITGNFTVSAGDVISFHVDSPDIPTNLTLTPFIGVVNSLEIVPVPEPGTACLALAGSALLWRGRQRTA
ncbi:MAG: hypothetical protein AAF916_05775 [Planctomycetota bacterium]